MHASIAMRLTKAWTAINRLSIIWKSDLTDKMKCSFFQAAVISILLYGCTTWTLTKRLEKKLDSNYTRMLRAILNTFWRQHPTRHQLYGHLPPIMKTIQVRRTRHAGHCWRSRDKLIRDVLKWTPHMARQKQDDQHEHTFSSYVRIRDVALKTCQRRWTIGRSGKRGSGISVQAAQCDDDDDEHSHSWACSQSPHWEWMRPHAHCGTPQYTYNLPFLMLKLVFTSTRNSTRELHSSTELWHGAADRIQLGWMGKRIHWSRHICYLH